MSPLSRRSASQADLFSSTSPLRTQVITRRKDFDELFDGFSKMRAVSYVMSVDLLLDFYDKRGYTDLEIVVGERLIMILCSYIALAFLVYSLKHLKILSIGLFHPRVVVELLLLCCGLCHGRAAD